VRRYVVDEVEYNRGHGEAKRDKAVELVEGLGVRTLDPGHGESS
jgi:hypothetical protein